MMMRQVHPAFGSTLRTVRQKQNVSLRQLAKMLDCSFATVHNWETGLKVPRQRNLEALLAALQPSIRDRVAIMRGYWRQEPYGAHERPSDLFA